MHKADIVAIRKRNHNKDFVPKPIFTYPYNQNGTGVQKPCYYLEATLALEKPISGRYKKFMLLL